MRAKYEINGNTLVLTLCGELDDTETDKIKSQIHRKTEKYGIKNLVFDMSGLEFMDSSGLGLIMGRYREFKETGGKVKIAGAAGQVKNLLKLSGVNTIIPICREAETALKGM